MVPRALAVVLAFVTLDAFAADIYKCVEGGATSYQSAPCARGQFEARLQVGGTAMQAAQDLRTAVATPTALQPRKRSPWTHTAVEIGVSDDEVLNMPGWGRPMQISRSRGAKGWQEVWRYGNANSGERQLRFVNARLADIVEAPAAVAYVR